MRFPYPKSLRLVRGWEYDLVFRTGNRLRGDLVRLVFVQSPDGSTRIGLAIGKRQGKAHERNRGRRVLKEGIRRFIPWIREGVWLVLSLRTAGMKADGKSVYLDLGALLLRSGFLRDDWPGLNWEEPSRGGGSM